MWILSININPFFSEFYHKYFKSTVVWKLPWVATQVCTRRVKIPNARWYSTEHLLIYPHLWNIIPLLKDNLRNKIKCFSETFFFLSDPRKFLSIRTYEGKNIYACLMRDRDVTFCMWSTRVNMLRENRTRESNFRFTVGKFLHSLRRMWMYRLWRVRVAL